jgi:hypothetical protein
LIKRENDNFTISHYSTLDVLNKIITNKTLRFTNILKLRDPKEGKNGLYFFGYDSNTINDILIKHNIYTFSTTDYNDDLGM